MIYKIEKFEEAFSAGKSSMVVEKLGKILSRRIGKRITFSEIPVEYTSNLGNFAGYYGVVDNLYLLRINFLLGKSDAIYSFDVYSSLDPIHPDYSVEVYGDNIVMIVDTLEENLIDDGLADLNESIIKERGRPSLGDVQSYQKMIDYFVKDIPDALDALQRMNLNDVFAKYFAKWKMNKPNYADVKSYFFNKVAKQWILDKGLSNKFFRKRKKAGAERQIEDPNLQAQLQDMVQEQITSEEKFEMLNALVTQASNNILNSVIITGSPGSGKTHETIKAIEENGLVEDRDYVVYRGGFAGVEELIRILWNSQELDRKLILFDDCDNSLKPAYSNIWKSILDVGDRTVTYLSKSQSPMLKGIPPKFSFDSSVIFISNLPINKIDSALRSRSQVINIDISNEEMVKRLEDRLKDFMPEVDISIKKQALEFLNEIHKGIETVDFRSLRNVIVAITSGVSNWKKFALMLMSNI